MSENKLRNLIVFASIPWKLISAIIVIITLFIGLFTIDNRFAKSDEIKALKTNITNERKAELKTSEFQVVKTLYDFRIQQQIMNQALQYQIYNIQKESISKEYWNLKRRIKDNPLDDELKEDFAQIKIQKEYIQQKIDSSLLTQD